MFMKTDLRRWTLEVGRWKLGRWTLDVERWDIGRWSVGRSNVGRWSTLYAQHVGRWNVRRWTLDVRTFWTFWTFWTFGRSDVGGWTLKVGRRALDVVRRGWTWLAAVGRCWPLLNFGRRTSSV